MLRTILKKITAMEARNTEAEMTCEILRKEIAQLEQQNTNAKIICQDLAAWTHNYAELNLIVNRAKVIK